MEGANKFAKFMDCGSNTSAIVYVPEAESCYRLEFGTGDNLLPEDRENGYNDYINIAPIRYNTEIELFEDSDEADGGMYMFNNEKYSLSEYKIQNFVDIALREISKDYYKTPDYYVIAVW